MYLDNYHCDWERVQIVLKSDDDTKCDSICIMYPRQMWNNILGQWEQYCPKDVASAFQCAIGDDVNIEGYNESESVRCVTYTRADGYQLAKIKFLMEGP